MFSRKTEIKTQAHTGPLLPLAKKKKKRVIITQAHTREREKRKYSQFKTHGVTPATR